jgi:hypothetical protein
VVKSKTFSRYRAIKTAEAMLEMVANAREGDSVGGKWKRLRSMCL